MKITLPNAQVTLDLSTPKKRDWFIAQIADRLEPLTADFQSLVGRDCLAASGKLFNLMRGGDPLVTAAGSALMKHAVIHSMIHAHAPIKTWNDYWDRLIWQQFTSMLTVSCPLLMPDGSEEKPEVIQAFQNVTESIFHGLEVLELVRTRPEQFHWNCHGDEPMAEKGSDQIALLEEARERLKQRVLGYAEHLRLL